MTLQPVAPRLPPDSSQAAPKSRCLPTMLYTLDARPSSVFLANLVPLVGHHPTPRILLHLEQNKDWDQDRPQGSGFTFVVPSGGGTARGAMRGARSFGQCGGLFPHNSPLCFFSAPHRPCSTPPPVSPSAVAAG